METQPAAQPISVAPALPVTLPRRADLLLLPVLSLLWGSSYMWISLLLAVFNTPALLMVRMLIAGLMLAIVLVLRRGRLPRFGKLWLHIAAVALLADLIPLGMLVWAQSQIPSSMAAIINATIPLFAMLSAALVFRSERLGAFRLTGIAFAFAGVLLMSGSGQSGPGSIVSPGVLAASDLPMSGVM